MSGIIEGEETLILKFLNGKRLHLPPKACSRGGSLAKRGLSVEQIPIIIACNRHGATTDAMLRRMNLASIAAALDGIVTKCNAFSCDGGSVVVAFTYRAEIAIHVLLRPGPPDHHLNGIGDNTPDREQIAVNTMRLQFRRQSA